MKRIIVLTALAVAATGCVKQFPEGEPIPLPTAVPATTATTAPPVTAPPVTAPPFEWCGISGPGISEDTEISTLDTTGYGGPGSDYCMGFEYIYWQRNTDLIKEACGDAFWGISDDEILRLSMSPDGGSNSRDYSIGMIDGFWTVC